VSGLLEGVRGAVLAPGEGAQRAGVLLTGMGATLGDEPAGADFCILDADRDIEGLRARHPAMVVLVMRDGGDGESAALTAVEAVAAVVTGLRHAGRTLAGLRIDLDAAHALAAATGEALMVEHATGGGDPS